MGALLLKNLDVNGLCQVTVHAYAVGDRERVAAFHLPREGNAGLGSLRDLGEVEHVCVHAQVRPLDALLPSLGTVRLLKVDVEGAEPLVIRGAVQLIRRDRPFVIMELTEAMSAQLGCSIEEILSFLASCGYRVLDMEDGRREVRGVPTRQTNVLCVPCSTGMRLETAKGLGEKLPQS
jgi:FkbM family methyltransferase